MVSRVELEGSGKINYDSSELKANYLEFDNFNYYILAKGHSVFKTQKEVTTSASHNELISLEATSQYIKSDIKSMITTLMYDVKVVNKTKLSGNDNITTQEAKIDMKKNTITMTGAATIYKAGSSMSASKAIYDLASNTLVGSDNISLKFKQSGK